ncbi:3-polyprenyl-4-hydroxybenzoate decarboxylase [Penicillium sp. IBT 18751x]|nr:3-polyprenyl-4-hydroxybenzoate decarboxylase [Penicillium sp. IBT 18751x]
MSQSPQELFNMRGCSVSRIDLVAFLTQHENLFEAETVQSSQPKPSYALLPRHFNVYVVQVDRKRLVEMKTTPETFCRQVGEVVFSSKPGRFVPKIFIVGDNIDPTSPMKRSAAFSLKESSKVLPPT